MHNSLKTQNKFLKAVVGVLIFANAFIYAHLANAITNYPPGSLLQPNDVTSSHIRNNEIVNADINASAAIVPTKLWGEGSGGKLFFTNYATFGTSTALTWATSTSKLTVTGSLAVSASTTFNGVEYLFPSADGSANQALKTNGAGGMSWGTVTASQVVGSFTAGKAITAGQSLFIATTTAQRTSIFDPGITTDTTVQVGDIANRTREAQKFTEAASYRFEYVDLKLSKTGAPGDNFIVSVQADSAGVPSGTMLASSTINGSNLTTGEVVYRFALDNPITTTASAPYYLVFQRSGANDLSNYYRVSIDGTGTTYGNGGRYSYDGATWGSQGAPDYDFELIASTTVGRVYPTIGSSASTTITFVGIANENATAGSSFAVVVGGIANNLSGLTTGLVYYVSNTAGAISSTAGTVSKKVGAALSATTLLIQNTW